MTEARFRTTVSGLSVVFMLSAPGVAAADVVTPLFSHLAPFIPYVIVVEVVGFWLLATLLLDVEVGFWKPILAVLIANLVTSALGEFIQLYRPTDYELLRWIGVAFVVSVVIESGIYIPFFRKTRLTILQMLSLAFVVNLASYVLVTFLAL